MSKVRRNNRKSRSSGGSSCDKSNRLYQIIPARNLSLPLLFLITNVIVYIYINWPSTTGSFVTGQFPRTKQQSNRTFRSAPPIPEEGNISCARSTVFPQRRTTPHARSNRERKKGFIRTIYTGKIAYHRGRKKSCQVHRGLETQRSHCLGRWFVSGEWKEVDSSANLASRSLSNPFYTTILRNLFNVF